MANLEKGEQQTTEDKNSNDDEQQNDQQQSTDSQNSMNLALIGGVVGASVGLLASPDTGKKVAGRIGQSEVIRGAGRELRRTAQEIITEQAMITLRQTATGYWNKYEGKLLGQGQEEEITKDRTSSTENNEDGYSEQYKELKEENKNLNENLQRIEEKLNALLEAKG
ncbi:gas vesicle protein GvpP [Halobacillus shinanisalinarum]|uniref:Gas vesicle protein GvpP n=1 Tax=Halobacillus shinanisalinarum TaxID=2932258 RepID=A0ABY4GYD3_9BACI|nr:GvpT/GvpP family gas vesicle accessory protein [Halobacillus shinanisalinarum]UOQ92417.1 gas vesicle protein GvpP [Halobacillus shinanisalinarum]